MEAENFQVDRELLAEVEPLIPWIRKSEHKPDLTGRCRWFCERPVAPANPDYRVDLDFLGVDVVPGSLADLGLDDLRGHCAVTPAGVVTVRDISTRIPIPQAAPAPIPGDAEGGTDDAGTASDRSLRSS